MGVFTRLADMVKKLMIVEDHAEEKQDTAREDGASYENGAPEGVYDKLKRSYYSGSRETDEQVIEDAVRAASRGENNLRTDRNKVSLQYAIKNDAEKKKDKENKEKRGRWADGVWSEYKDGKRVEHGTDRFSEENKQPRKSKKDLDRDINGKDVKNGEAEKAKGPAKKSMEDLKREINDRQKESDDDAAERKVDELINAINKRMDDVGEDEIVLNKNGYNLRYVRVPVEGSEMDVQINGKKVYVHEDLKGDAIARFGKKTEVSRDLAEEAMDAMMSKDSGHWEKDIESGAGSVSAEMDIRAGRGTVSVNKDLKDSETRTIPGGPAVSRDVWDECYGKMKENNKSRWAMTMEDGSTVECSYVIRVNRETAGIAKFTEEESPENESPFEDLGPAVFSDEELEDFYDEDFPQEEPYIDEEYMEAEYLSESAEDKKIPDVYYDEEARMYGVSEDKWDSVYKSMSDSGKTYFAETLPDGTEVTAELIVKVNGMKRQAAIRDDLAPGTVAADAPARTEISREAWEKAKEQMMSDPQGRCSMVLDNGTKLTGELHLKADDEKAYVNRPMKADEIRDEKDYYVISGEAYKGWSDRMDKEKRTVLTEKLPDGKTLKLKKEETDFEIHTTDPDGREMSFKGEEKTRKIMRLAFEKDKSKYNKFVDELSREIIDEATTGAARRLPGKVMSAPYDVVKGVGSSVDQGIREASGLINATNSFIMAGVQIGR